MRRGWNDTLWTHISASVTGEPGHHLLNRLGLRFAEVTAENLVKVDVARRVIDGSGAPLEVCESIGAAQCPLSHRWYSRCLPKPAPGDPLRISPAGPPWMTGLRRPTWTPLWPVPATSGPSRCARNSWPGLPMRDSFSATSLDVATSRPGQWSRS
ncbi:MAG: class II aldolase/adducin family protein [Betaproteobacteria bacterium]|nr:class II aldolase/adducin family protein [Betaproteobacteria bacterium]